MEQQFLAFIPRFSSWCDVAQRRYDMVKPSNNSEIPPRNLPVFPAQPLENHRRPNWENV
jgi:hypothetical protein